MIDILDLYFNVSSIKVSQFFYHHISYRILTGICPSPYKLAGICPSAVIFNFLTDQKQINFTVVTDVSLDHVLSKTDNNFYKAVWIIKIHKLKVALVDSEIVSFSKHFFVMILENYFHII
jgi:hypothetical protein